MLSTLFVTNDSDSAPGSLRSELAAAKAGDTIRFKPGAYGTITLTGGPLEVATGVDIHGPGANKVTVSGDDKSTVFDIPGGVTATISGLTVTDGSADTPYVPGAGGILNAGTLTLCDVVVTGNSTAPGVFIFGAGGVSNFGTLTVTGSTISDNSGNSGGGILNTGSLSMTDSTISGNTGAGGGGGIDSFASLSLTDCVVSGNTGVGIAISIGYGYPTSALTVADSRIVNNTNEQGTSLGLGGGISAFDSAVTVTDSTISNNIAEGSLASGAGIFMGTNFSSTSGSVLTVTDSALASNQAIATETYGNGGAIHTDPGTTVSVKNSSFLDNVVTSAANAQGGAMDLEGLIQGTISDSVFAGNQAVAPTTSGGGSGGAIANTGSYIPSVLTVSGSTFAGNLAQGYLGLGGAIINQDSTTLNLSSSTFVGNRAIGGTAPNYSGSGTIGGFAVGGALDNDYATATVNNSTFFGNAAMGGAASGAGNRGGSARGGAIANHAGTLNVIGGAIVGNTAIGGGASDGATGGDGEGGGVDNSGTSANAALTGVLISLNVALGGSNGGKGYGGGLYIATGAITTLKDTHVVANRASTAGDNIYGTPTNA